MSSLPSTQDASNRAHMIREGISDAQIDAWIAMVVSVEDMGPANTLMAFDESVRPATGEFSTLLALLLQRETQVGFDALCHHLPASDFRWPEAMDLARTTGTVADRAVTWQGELQLLDQPRLQSAVAVACQHAPGGWTLPALAQWMLQLDPTLDRYAVFRRFEQTALALFLTQRETEAEPLANAGFWLAPLAQLATLLGQPESAWTDALLSHVAEDDGYRLPNDQGGPTRKLRHDLRSWMAVVIQGGDLATLTAVLDQGLQHRQGPQKMPGHLSYWFNETLSAERLLPLAQLLIQRTPVLDVPVQVGESATWRTYLDQALCDPDAGFTEASKAVLRALLRQDALQQTPAFPSALRRARPRS